MFKIRVVCGVLLAQKLPGPLAGNHGFQVGQDLVHEVVMTFI